MPTRLLFGVVCLTAEVFIPYHRYVGYLKFLTLVLFVYVAAAFSVQVPWLAVLKSTLLPQISLNRDYLLTVVAVFGTTISPYLFFWQASQEAEESNLSHRQQHEPRSAERQGVPAHRARHMDGHGRFQRRSRFSSSSPRRRRCTRTASSTFRRPPQAAEALRPIAGVFTFALFSAGIIGTGLLAVPVLAGSAAYAVAESFHLRGSLELPANRAIGFYAIVSAATLAGAGLTLTSIDPIAMLFWTAVINGVVAVPIMAVMMIVISPRGGKQTLALPSWLKRSRLARARR